MGMVSRYHRQTFSYNESDTETFTWDNQEEKTGMSQACQFINNKISPLLKDKDPVQFKRIDDILQNFKNREEEDGVTKIGSNVIAGVS
jgi:enolase